VANNVDLHFADSLGRAHVVRVVTMDGHDWHLCATIDGRMFSKHCSSWQRVERVLTWLRRHAHEPLAVDTAPPARARNLAAAAIAVLMLTFSAAATMAQPLRTVSPAEAAFIAATNDYVAMHRRLEKLVGPITLNSSVEQINRTIEVLAMAIRSERPDAKQGDLFTLALARELRLRVNDALMEHGFSALDIQDEERVEGVDPATVRLRVNGTFPWVLAAGMLPCVIDALPPLPPELQYRIVGHDLVLIDVHASLIVDILPEVVAQLTVRNF
jgi:hypothetical protein